MSASTSKSIAVERVFPHSFALNFVIVAFGSASAGLTWALRTGADPMFAGLMATFMFASTLVGIGATVRLGIDYYFEKKKA